MIVRTAHRRGISLLEVLAALAIFMLSIVVISQMVNSAAHTADKSRRLTQAGLYCEAKMAEVASGIQPLASVGMTPLENADGWEYSIECQPQDFSNVQIDNQSLAALSLVEVTVRYGNDVEQSLSRVVLDPRVRVPTADPTPSTSSNGSSGSSGGASGGSMGGSGSKGGSGKSKSGGGSGKSTPGAGAPTGGGGAPVGGGSVTPGAGSGAKPGGK
jgi:type II secretory pathway pseudopilin PulG